MRNKVMTLSDIHELSINMLKAVDIFCVKNGIQYSLGYGSLIGAVRHKGFNDYKIIISYM